MNDLPQEITPRSNDLLKELRARKERIVTDLRSIEDAITALEKNPDLVTVISALRNHY